ncbi:hypothetical protein SB49_03190 [Sediminicola sp. YIK13]|uniref:hypothetical protein n=1 Tax=Sediminicola sp. YIK13 TaxID=1453352 RepID=UPI000721AF8E|nr:hypothetical protein [Sediminicola sp. YIK13]ALM06916.1 hypothetical protein SB49_03190 [Sediminicola sp. YIK13]
MDHIETLSACHHRFRFLLEELSDESGGVLKKNRLVEELKNEIEVYCSVSTSFFLDPRNKRYADQLNIMDFNGESIKRSVVELNSSAKDKTTWRNQIFRLKEEVENLLFHYEKVIGSSLKIIQN